MNGQQCILDLVFDPGFGFFLNTRLFIFFDNYDINDHGWHCFVAHVELLKHFSKFDKKIFDSWSFLPNLFSAFL